MWQAEDRMAAMLFKRPKHVPVGVGFLPATWMKYREALDALVRRYPTVYNSQDGPRDYDAVGGTYVAGNHVDVWGCVWSNIRDGMESIVTGHPVPTRGAVHTLKPPLVDAGFPHGFMYLRLCDLRGFDEMMIDFAEEPPELQMLIDVVLEYNLRQIDKIIRESDRSPRLLYFGDDLGLQHSLPISPEKWRKYLKPCYARIYQRCRDVGWWVYMHTDGHIIEIIPDLIDAGVNVINAQVRANGLDHLAAVCKGKVCVCLDLDRQLFPFCRLVEIDAHVREAVEKLGSPEGGLWLTAECGPDVPLENIEAILASLDKYRKFYS